jgi:hypothetical protein
MKALYRNTMAMLLILTLTACAQLGLQAPQTFNQKAAVAYGTVTQIRETAVPLLAAKKISAEDAQNTQASADVARLGVDTARRLHAADPNAADARISAVITSLNALAAYLASREAAKQP